MRGAARSSPACAQLRQGSAQPSLPHRAREKFFLAAPFRNHPSIAALRSSYRQRDCLGKAASPFSGSRRREKEFANRGRKANRSVHIPSSSPAKIGKICVAVEG